MHEEHYDNWEQFERRFLELQDRGADATLGDRDTLFRGHQSASWSLATTLEHRISADVAMVHYFNVIAKAYPEIDGLGSSLLAYDQLLSFDNQPPNFDDHGVDLFLKGLPNQAFLVFLRQHGFPSPLLDWTRSPYIAAFFAFQHAAKSDIQRSAVYALVDNRSTYHVEHQSDPGNIAIGWIDKSVRTHKRHFLQQGDYTYCYTLSRRGLFPTWNFVPHEEYFLSGTDVLYDLYKISIPNSERLKILRRLDQLNLNPFSLFGTVDSLMESISLRMIEFPHRYTRE